MGKEQEEIIQAFRNAYDPAGKEPLAIYGTGINAQAVITSCGDYPIAGVVDAARTGETFCGLPVLSPDEVVERHIRKIVVVARPSVLGIIYKRIQGWCAGNGILVSDIYGNDIAQKIKVRTHDMPYYKLTCDDLRREIDSYEIISFDIFDTLLMRKVYEPADVFSLVDRELGDRFPFLFSEERKAAERGLGKECEPTIYQIYGYLAEKHHLSEKEMLDLLSRELEKEKSVLCVRERMKHCMEYCIRQGKKVYLVSDMYLPAELLGELLGQYGITGYTELLVSCDYRTRKPERLFEVLKGKAGRTDILHIGDHKEADYDAPKRHGIDAFLIMPSIRMMECSAYSDTFIHLKSVPSRIMLGMLAAEVFRDPFVLSGTKGTPVIADAEHFGYAFIAPLALSFTVWMIHKVRSYKDAVLLFSARDGWILQKIFRQLAEAWKLSALPEDLYLMVSRKALELAGRGGETEKNYRAYLETLGLEGYDTVFYVDFMSRGTCQSLLESITGRELQGIYFQKSVSGIASKDAVQVWAYFKERSAHEKDLRIFALCDFLECIFTSYLPSFYRISREGEYVYETEKRTESQLEILKKIHSGIFRYCKEFAEIFTELPGDMPSSEFCDEILKFTSSEYSRTEIPELKDFMLDDWLGGDKNTGMDALM